MPLLLCVIGAVLFGCTSTRTARVGDLQRLTPGLDRGVALATTAGWRSRLDPNTWVRLENKRGGFSKTIRAADLRVDARGVFAPTRLSMTDALGAIRIEGIDEGVRELVEPTPGVSVKQLRGGALLIEGRPAELSAWVGAFVKRVTDRFPLDETPGLVRARDNGAVALCGDLDEPGCVAAAGDRVELMRWERDMPELIGTWRLRVGATWQAPLAGSSLLVTLRWGVDSIAHYPWAEIAAVELTDVSGVKTAGAIVGYAAITTALLPLALLGAGFGALPGRGGSSGSGGGSGGNALSLGRVGGLGGGHVPADGAWTGALDATPRADTRRLFSGSARRKSAVRFTLSGDTAVDTLRAGSLVERLSLGVRLGDLVELGGGLGYAWVPGATERHDLFGFVRLGLHLPLDAAHKYAIPLGLDFGTYMPDGYLRVKHARLDLGLRRRIGDDLFVGAYLFNPTYLATNREEKRWSLSSGLEISAAF